MNIKHRWLRTAVSAALCSVLALPSAFALFPAKVKADSLCLRATPGGTVLTTLSNGTYVAVLENSTSWFKVAVDGKTGYVSREYLTGASNGDFRLGSGRIVCDTTVNLREQPSTSSAKIASMPNGATVQARGVYNGWFKVIYNGKTGYMHPDYLSIGAPAVSATVDPEGASTKTPTSNAASSQISYEATGDARSDVLSFAAQYLGTPYVYGGSTPSGFDCSGFTSYVYKNTVGTIPRVAQSQFDAITRVSREELLPGDLVFFGSSASSISHVGIYTGDDTFIHSPHTGDVVKYDSLTGSYASRFQGGGRVISD